MKDYDVPLTQTNIIILLLLHLSIPFSGFLNDNFFIRLYRRSNSRMFYNVFYSLLQKKKKLNKKNVNKKFEKWKEKKLTHHEIFDLKFLVLKYKFYS